MVDVTIRGAGIFGLSVAWVCVQRGAKVQIVDPHGPGAGSSGGIVGALAPHVPENWNEKKAFQLESLLMAPEFWGDVEKTGQRSSGYKNTGRIQPILDENGLSLAQKRSETANVLWQGKASWHVEKISGAGWCPASPTGWFIRDTLSALLHPRQAIHALYAALLARNVSVVERAPDQGKVLWATGIAGLEMLNTTHHRMMGTGVKGQAAVLKFDARGAAQLFVDGVHIIPHLNGTVAIGSTSERDYTSPTSTDSQLDDVIKKARSVLPILSDAAVLERWAGIRPRTRSRAPMLGQWSGRDGHFIANGGFKIGFGMAPKIAHVMADLMLNGKDEIPEGFRVDASR
ncbi:MAG: FAD-binding oxidoreductase [Roseobacter sp.]